MVKLNNSARDRAIGMINAGMNISVVARQFGVCKKTIQRLIHRFDETGSVKDRV